ncbi:8-oxo-dGTP diphosphatase MutT [Halopseudomonas sp.]|uniref:8-oxo-dGTP diphosphatase MutT n=1 Tax=Halopseudomonas sp. TaxID=2901191 RepID=UPI00300163B1
MAAVIRRNGHILIARRPATAHQGGLWEFPGGKLEPGEDRYAGLRRELQEELDINITSARPLIDIRHDYPDKSVRLDVWLVEAFDGEAHGAEGQPIRWVTPAELDQYQFPSANVPIVSAARLPERYLITPDAREMAELVTGLEKAREQGVSMVQLRQTHLSDLEYERLAEQLVERFGSDFTWILKDSAAPAGAAGWHLTALQLNALHRAGWRKGEQIASVPSCGGVFAAGPPLLPEGGQPLDRKGFEPWHGLLAASCHDEQELEMAAGIGADFVTLSPVLPTRSHPGARPLGWQEAARLIALTNLPVYLLGGLSTQHLDQAFQAGAQGIAGISGLWPD